MSAFAINTSLTYSRHGYVYKARIECGPGQI